MKCPNTSTCPETDLVMTERQGVEIDYCPKCRGVWLDRGELDKLMDRAASQATQTSSPQPSGSPATPQQAYTTRRGPDFDDSDFHHGRSGHSGYRKKKSWLSDIFD